MSRRDQAPLRDSSGWRIGPSFDVVLLDLVMPEMDGFATLAVIKAKEVLRHQVSRVSQGAA